MVNSAERVTETFRIFISVAIVTVAVTDLGEKVTGYPSLVMVKGAMLPIAIDTSKILRLTK